ncbi:MAG: molybdenum ABC transporter ATP-binding protein [Rhizobiales bacterium]|nr:molybdenum ABC transporter ATP-binding protein [Hyphomicrobiales bacterium]
MSLSLDIRHRQGSFTLEAAFTSSGRLTALFGPSGSGKTSIVNLIGGLICPDEGRIESEGRVFVDTAHGVFLPAHRRRIGYVFQDARLFPHMSVRQNLGYGRFFTPPAERYADMDAVVDLLGIRELLERRPGNLSGGEKQRVAIGRALAASPRLLLMDEPLASLDDARKAEILPYLERLRDESKVPVVYVSHALAEVARLATDVVMLAEGRVTASGPVDAVLARLDILPPEQEREGGTVIEARVVSHEGGLTVLRSAAGEWRVPGKAESPGNRVRLRIRARDVMIATERPRAISALNILEGRIVGISGLPRGDVQVGIDCAGDTIQARITGFSAQALRLCPGMRVFALVKAISLDPGAVA